MTKKCRGFRGLQGLTGAYIGRQGMCAGTDRRLPGVQGLKRVHRVTGKTQGMTGRDM